MHYCWLKYVRLFKNGYVNIQNIGTSKERQKRYYLRTMYSNYFEKLIHQARYLDNGIERLNETWKLPSVLIGRFGNCTEETESHIEALSNIIKNTQNGIEETLVKLKEDESQGSESMEQLLQETEKEYESLKEQCDNLETVLAEYGYHHDKPSTLDSINTNSSTESSQHLAKEMENLEVEFTPNLSWKYKVKQNSTPLFNTSSVPNLITTPVVNKLPSLLGDTSVTYKDSINTPLREHPKEQINSKQLYRLFKK